MKKILVTGASGFLGGHLSQVLTDQGHELTALSSNDCDLKIQGSLNKFNSTKYDQIFHLAAWTQAGDFCLSHQGEQWIINQKMNTNALSWWKEFQPQAKMIAIGSSCCYQPGTPHLEESFLTGMPTESLFTYAMTKRMLYTGLISLNKQYGMKYLFVVPSTLYGADYHLDGRQMHFIFDLMRKIVNGKNKGDKVELWGDGTQKRELIHVRDFIKATLELNVKTNNEIVNIGGGAEYSIKEFAEMLCLAVGYDSSKIFYDKSKYVGAQSKFLITDKLQKLLPEFKQTSLKKGLEETVQWFIQNYKS